MSTTPSFRRKPESSRNLILKEEQNLDPGFRRDDDLRTNDGLLDRVSREQAASELEKNVIVLAGAGTGKTHLLIDRLCLLILGKGLPVERIVALTFTRKAGEEMRIRLEERLRTILDDPASFPLLEEKFSSTKPLWEERARKALDDIPKAQIGTIHSFAAHLLRLYPIQAEVDPAFREDEGEITDEMFDQEWRQWLKDELRTGAGRISLWATILKHVEVPDLKDLARALASPQVDPSNLKSNVDLEELIRAGLKEIQLLKRACYRSDDKTMFSEAFLTLENVFAQALAKEKISETLRTALEECDFSRPPKGWGETAEDKARIKKSLKDLRGTALGLARIDEELLFLALEVVRPFITAFKARMIQQGWISFDGLLVFARNLVRDHPPVREALKKQYAAFLVDEFQDTDPLQGEILFYLAGEPGESARNWSGVRLAPGRLFVVGDPKQSIYRFRGADMQAFYAFHTAMVSQGAIQAYLTTNFRSVRPLLEGVNTIFGKTMEEKHGVQPPYVALVPKASAIRDPDGNMDSGVRRNDEFCMLLVTTDGLEKGPRASQMREFEAELVADWIWNAASSNGKAPALAYRDVALLLRSSNAFQPYLEAFKKRGIPYLAEGEKFFYKTYEVTEFLNLVSTVADPRDKLSLVGILRSPVGGLTDKEIFDLNETQALDYRTQPPILQEKVSGLYRLLSELNEKSHVAPVSELIREIFSKTWILERMCQFHHGEQALANLSKILHLAQKWGEEGPLTFKTFVRRLKRYREEERDEGENPLADANYDAVKVLTIHKGKGLEFPVVILPNLCAEYRPAAFEKPLLLNDWSRKMVGLRLRRHGAINAAMLLLEKAQKEHEEAEEIRIFYVASTRAKKKMIYVLRSEAGGATSPYAGILKKSGVFPQNGQTAVQLSHITIPVQTEPYKEPDSYKKIKLKAPALAAEWKPARLAKTHLARRAEYERVLQAEATLSPTQLLRELEKGWVRLDEEQEKPSDAILLGLLCHKVMEEWDFESPPNNHAAQLENLIIRGGRLLEVMPNDPLSQSILHEARDLLQGFLKTAAYKTLTQVKIMGREVPFLHPLRLKNPDLEPLLMHGVIDLIYEQKGQLVIVDYKTNKVTKSALSHLREHYRRQGDAYKEAVRRALNRCADFDLVFLRSGDVVRV